MGRNSNNGLANLQCFIGIKGSSDIIISENHVSGQGGYRTSGALLFQYGPERVWFLFNTIHDINGGILSGSNSVPSPGTESYYIGNLIYNITQKEGDSWNPNSAWSNAAMRLVGGVNRYIIGNTIYNVDAGINCPGGGSLHIYNNIISNVTQPEGHHIFIESRLSTPDSTFENNLFFQEGGAVSLKWGDISGDVSAFESATEAAQNNLEAYPQFMDAENSDFRLQPTSPAISAGTSSGVVQQVFDAFETLYGIDIRKDIEGIPRTDPWDIGAHETITVPNVVGLSQGSAESAIISAGLLVGTETSAYSNAVPVGSVISQSPSAGTYAAEGSSVNLVISIGAVVYVDGDNGDDISGDGTDTNPYKTVAKAVQAAVAGDKIIVMEGTYPENITLNKQVTIESQGGLVRIGQ